MNFSFKFWAATLAVLLSLSKGMASADTSATPFLHYYNESWRLVAIDPAQALDTAHRYYELARVESDSLEMGYALDLIGLSHYYQNNNDTALRYFEQAAEIFRALPDSAGLSEALTYQGMAQIYRGNFSTSLEAFRRSFQIDTSLQTPSAEAFYHYNLGMLLSEQQAYEQALPFYRQALRGFVRDSLHLYQLPGLYISISECLIQLEQYDAALDTARLALSAARRYDDKSSQSTAYALMGDVFREKEQFSAAEGYLDSAYRIDTAFGDPYTIAYDYRQYALLHLAKGQNQKALAYIHRARDMAATEKVILLRRDVYKTLARAEAVAGHPKKAYQALKRYQAIMDTLRPLDTYHQIFLLNKKVSQKELALSQAHSKLQAQQLERKNRYLLISAAALILALVLLGVFYQLRRRLQRSNAELQGRNAEIEKQRAKLKDSTNKLRQQKQTLEKLNRGKDRLFSILAHDLKQPFLQLTQTIELIRQKDMSPDERAELLDGLKQNVQRTSQMVNNLLTWSKAQFAGISVNPQSLNLSALAKKQALQMSNLLDEKKLDIYVDVDPQAYVCADPEHLAIIVRNMLHNAIKYSYQGGKIELTASQPDPHHRALEVRDHGRGMPPDKVDELMKVHSQQSEPGTFMESGTGLGLLIIKELLAENQGRLQIESQPDQGSIFTIILPSSTPQSEPTAKTNTPQNVSL